MQACREAEGRARNCGIDTHVLLETADLVCWRFLFKGTDKVAFERSKLATCNAKLHAVQEGLRWHVAEFGKCCFVLSFSLCRHNKYTKTHIHTTCGKAHVKYETYDLRFNSLALWKSNDVHQHSNSKIKDPRNGRLHRKIQHNCTRQSKPTARQLGNSTRRNKYPLRLQRLC
jgi:hypothetical protein